MAAHYASAVRVGAMVVARDEERHIAASLRSLLDQDCPIDEIVVVDDGSKDSTADVAARVLRGFSGGRVVRISPSGRPVARNRALTELSSDIVLVADADDVSLPNRVAIHLEAFEDRSLGWHAAQMIAVNDDGVEVGWRSSYATDRSVIAAKLARPSSMPVSHATSAFRSTLVGQLGQPFYAPYCLRAQDFELLLTLGESVVVESSAEHVLEYRWSPQDRSWSKWRKTAPWRRYAIAHSSWRRSAVEPVTFGEWWGGLSPLERAVAVDPARFIHSRALALGAGP